MYPSYCKLLGCWLPSLTPVAYLSKLLGIHSVSAYKQLELFWVYISGSARRTRYLSFNTQRIISMRRAPGSISARLPPTRP
ncbi:hypothetical protein BSR00_10450 [Serratia liquefaciens]|nr:hypothetical protein BSR00_10450 [Serratia liquefaciens]RYM80138.1 hypothetical protein BSR01_07835 [Serratia liquefaciens]